MHQTARNTKKNAKEKRNEPEFYAEAGASSADSGANSGDAVLESNKQIQPQKIYIIEKSILNAPFDFWWDFWFVFLVFISSPRIGLQLILEVWLGSPELV